MRHEEALDVLALGPGATPAEIKEAYRDLVKVWHPDRFGSDPRLRQKAEEKLQQINDAYRVLQSLPKHDFAREDAVRRHDAGPPSASSKAGARPDRAILGWILGGLIILVAVAIAAALALAHNGSQTQAPVVPETQPQESTDTGNHSASPLKAPKTPLKDASRPDHATAQVQVRQLSDVEAAQLETACPREMESKDPIGYRNCVRAQLDPPAPDLSALSAEDRAGIESACRKTQVRDGSAAYNRCLTRMVKLLHESSHP